MEVLKITEREREKGDEGLRSEKRIRENKLAEFLLCLLLYHTSISRVAT